VIRVIRVIDLVRASREVSAVIGRPRVIRVIRVVRAIIIGNIQDY